MLEKHKNTFQQINDDFQYLNHNKDDKDQKEFIEKEIKRKENSKNSWTNIVTNIYTSFNGSRYEIPLIKRYFPYSTSRTNYL